MIQYINQKFSSSSSLLCSAYIEPMRGYAICRTSICQGRSAATLVEPKKMHQANQQRPNATAIWIAYINVSLNFSGINASGELNIGAKIFAPKVIGCIHQIKNGSLINGIYFVIAPYTLAGSKVCATPSVMTQSIVRTAPQHTNYLTSILSSSSDEENCARSPKNAGYPRTNAYSVYAGSTSLVKNIT